MANYPSPWEPIPEKRSHRRQGGSWGQAILRGLVWGVTLSLLAMLLAVVGGLGVYAYYARSLPSPEELYQRTTDFKSTKIYDRHGTLLFEIFDPLGGRRTLVSYEDVPEEVIAAVVATEDATFFSNPGLNPIAIARALYHDIREGEVVQGGSTITQQLVKNVFLTRERTLSRKIKEAILAAEITRRYEKEEILEIYLNEVYYGNLAYGLGAASETYFDKDISELDLSEAALLAGLMQAPALYDPYTHPEAALARRSTVLRLMHESGFIGRAEREAADEAPLNIVPQEIVMRAPHMVTYVREQLEAEYGVEMLYRGGLQVHTTLDLGLQEMAQKVAQERIATLRQRDASNAAVVIVDPASGDILAMVGSVDFHDAAIDGQVNVARRLRQPGSTIKTITYLAALERGWSPSTMLMDVEQAFPDGANPPYRPHNYDHKEMGPISLRTALASSRNIPAVSTLYQIGLPALLEMSHRLGIHSLNRSDYGLSLTLGGGDVTLLEMTGAYATLANNGRRATPRAILRITDQEGNVVREQAPPIMPQVVDARHVYLVTHILADREARVPAFGRSSPLDLSFDAAVKTGTTNDYRDSWTIGYTRDLVVGVWVGNSDNTPMERVSGSQGAGLIWHDVMERALAESERGGSGPAGLERPDGLVEMEVCAVSGQRPGDHCADTVIELFASDSLPGECRVHREVRVCTHSEEVASAHCPVEAVETRVYQDYGPSWDGWAREQGLAVPPRQTCTLHDRPEQVSIEVPLQVASGIVQVMGTADIADFRHYVVEFAPRHAPGAWQPITPPIEAPVPAHGTLCRWDARSLANGAYTLRLLVVDHRGRTVSGETAIELRNPITMTPTPTSVQLPTEPPPAPSRRATPGEILRPTPTPESEHTPPPTPPLAPPPIPRPAVD